MYIKAFYYLFRIFIQWDVTQIKVLSVCVIAEIFCINLYSEDALISTHKV